MPTISIQAYKGAVIYLRRRRPAMPIPTFERPHILLHSWELASSTSQSPLARNAFSDPKRHFRLPDPPAAVESGRATPEPICWPAIWRGVCYILLTYWVWSGKRLIPAIADPMRKTNFLPLVFHALFF